MVYYSVIGGLLFRHKWFIIPSLVVYYSVVSGLLFRRQWFIIPSSVAHYSVASRSRKYWVLSCFEFRVTSGLNKSELFKTSCAAYVLKKYHSLNLIIIV